AFGSLRASGFALRLLDLAVIGQQVGLRPFARLRRAARFGLRPSLAGLGRYRPTSWPAALRAAAPRCALRAALARTWPLSADKSACGPWRGCAALRASAALAGALTEPVGGLKGVAPAA
ncbi:MAG: hypothetical protein RIT81_47040, partial [Deltaproteobacteria bacterium]